jgi:hypothetical protein
VNIGRADEQRLPFRLVAWQKTGIAAAADLG